MARAAGAGRRAAPSRLKLVGKVESGAGALRRLLDSGYRGATYDLISALTGGPSAATPTIAYTLDTKRARTEVRAQQTQGTLLRELVAKASNDANRDPQIGRTLFNLLVPVEMEPFLGGTSEMVIELDPSTAGIPWELLDTNPDARSGSDQRPWAIRSKLLRKLRIGRVPRQRARRERRRQRARDRRAALRPRRCTRRCRARAPKRSRWRPAWPRRVPAGADRRACASLDQRTRCASIINALFDRPYRVVHVAGHGAPGPNGGVVLSGTTPTSARTRSRRCGWCPSWCSSTAATSRARCIDRATPSRTTAPRSRPTSPRR